MARRRRLDKRGRPRQAKAKRRETTAAGRRGAPDRGTRELRRKKRRITTREDLEVTPIAALFGCGLLDAAQHDTLAQIADAIRLLAPNLGPRPDGVAALWTALTEAATGAQGSVPASVGPATDHARYVLRRMLRRLDGSRDLVMELAAEPPRAAGHAGGRASPLSCRRTRSRPAAPRSRPSCPDPLM